MKPLLHPAVTVVRRDRRTLQAGTVADRPILVEDRPGTAAILRLCDGTRDIAMLAAMTGLEPGEARATVASLVAAGLLLDAETWAGTAGRELVAEAVALSAAGHDAREVRRRVRSRSRCRVEVHADPATQPLAEAVMAVLATGGVTATSATVDSPTLVLVLSTGPCPREVVDVLTGAGVPHLPVVCESTSVRLGPLVRPGTTPCVRCDDRDRAGWDRSWPFVLAQHARPIASTAGHPSPLPAATRWRFAVTIAEQVLDYGDARPAATEGSVLVLGPGPDDRHEHVLAQAVGCACQIVEAATGPEVAPGVRMTA
ncbi:hypothetical protein CLV56_0849 [Mumia flava]|uniref:Bacteriocin biosynthesis cyclodehydratase domain-containing protein n=1 Tax=Mumia flava TaxID=1348852 RepID=A0A0B2B156_9ACTN|nr:hypothetical protein [Mumia flava]PJJ56638.1 hypothetical protein CLV56_0849 [Mumia flava]